MKLVPFKFKRPANRLCIWPDGTLPIPVAEPGRDEFPRIEMWIPTRRREYAVGRVDSQRVLLWLYKFRGRSYLLALGALE